MMNIVRSMDANDVAKKLKSNKRRRFLERYAYIMFAVLFLIVSWEYNTSSAALIDAHIPSESIRLRILANSDSPQDQLIKLKIRDQIVAHMNEWVQNPSHLAEARREVERHLPEFERLVGQVLQQYGYQYNFTVELDVVDFPTKIYGSKVYPAGDYEALRVVLGEGKGQNWWCVLFPPLCFIDIATSVTVMPDEDIDLSKLQPDDIEVRFFIWESLQKMGGYFKKMFNSAP